MKVLKFGGTSVGTVQSLRNVKKIIESISGPSVIVVSALGGITDKLISTAGMAAKKEKGWEVEYEEMRCRHLDIINDVISKTNILPVSRKIETLLSELKSLYKEVYKKGELTEKNLDEIVSFGERMSSVIVAAMLSDGVRYYSPDFIKTEKWYGKNIAHVKLTNKLIQKTFCGLKQNEKAIVPGFISQDFQTGHITNLGRGGSDYTAALIAAALGTEILEIWTDVDGFMTADPKIVKDAIVIDHLSFSESMELCTFGAKVIYPPTIFPVFHKNIPIKILNTFNPDAPGTLITDHSRSEDLEIKGVTSLKGVCLIKIGVSNKNFREEVSDRTFKVLIRQAVKIIPIINHDNPESLSFAIVASEAELLLDLLRNEFEEEIISGKITNPLLQESLSAVAVVGKDMRLKSGLSARVAHSLLRKGINIEGTSSGFSNISSIFIIKEEKCPQALLLIHELIFKDFIS